jgi:hypothetical protein
MMRHGVAPALMETLETAHFDLRKEAAYALVALANDSRLAAGILDARLLREAVSLLRAPDPEVTTPLSRLSPPITTVTPTTTAAFHRTRRGQLQDGAAPSCSHSRGKGGSGVLLRCFDLNQKS